MKKLNLGPKMYRAFDLLVGLRDSEVGAALAPHGFNAKELEEGWSLLEKATALRLGAPLPSSGAEASLASINSFEDAWFPVARSVLARHFPEVGRQLFANLAQTQGREAAVSVLTFISRMDEMANGSEPFGEAGREARGLLSSRGLTEAAVDQARADLAALMSLKGGAPAESDREIVEAEAALWAWYLEWSTIVRKAIKKRGLLRKMGFLRRRPAGVEEADESQTDALELSSGASSLAPAVAPVVVEPQLPGSATAA